MYIEEIKQFCTREQLCCGLHVVPPRYPYKTSASRNATGWHPAVIPILVFTEVKRVPWPKVMPPFQDNLYPMASQRGDIKPGLLHQLGTSLRIHLSSRAYSLAKSFLWLHHSPAFPLSQSCFLPFPHSYWFQQTPCALISFQSLLLV